MTSPSLNTKRLRLRGLRTTDAEFVKRLITDSVVRAYLGGVPNELPDPFTLDLRPVPDADGWIVSKDKVPMGLIDLSAHKDGHDIEVSYQFVPQAWGNGYATEALSAVMDYAFNVRRLPRIIAETQVANTRSVNLLSRLGMHTVVELMRFGEPQVIMARNASLSL